MWIYTINIFDVEDFSIIVHTFIVFLSRINNEDKRLLKKNF